MRNLPYLSLTSTTNSMLCGWPRAIGLKLIQAKSDEHKFVGLVMLATILKQSLVKLEQSPKDPKTASPAGPKAGPSQTEEGSKPDVVASPSPDSVSSAAELDISPVISHEQLAHVFDAIGDKFLHRLLGTPDKAAKSCISSYSNLAARLLCW